MTLFKWLIRIVLGLIAVVILVISGILVGYFFWERGHLQTLNTESEVIETAVGVIEYALVGEGIPRLMIHGTPGGYDQVLIPGKVRPESVEGQKIIAVSRPGYLRTPIESGRTPAQQADLYAALLDELNINEVVVYGASGGAPSALQFALRHPDRTIALLLVVPLLENLKGSPDAKVPSKLDMTIQDILGWLISKISVAKIVPDLDTDNSRQVQAAVRVVASAIPTRLREIGHRNDSVEFRRMDIENWPLEDLTVPVLMVHGDADENAPYEGSLRAVKRLPNAKLVTIENGTHWIVLTHAQEIDNQISRFLHSIIER